MLIIGYVDKLLKNFIGLADMLEFFDSRGRVSHATCMQMQWCCDHWCERNMMADFTSQEWLVIVNIVNRSRSGLTSSLLKKQARHQCDVCTPSFDCLLVYNQFVTPKKCMATTVSRFLKSRQENINNWKFESSWYEQYKRRPFCFNFRSL